MNREYRVVQMYGTAGIPWEQTIEDYVNGFTAEGWEFIQLDGSVLVMVRGEEP